MAVSRMDGLSSELVSESRRHPLVFLVGMPRSGTKLLRDLLNRHSDVAIFPNESHFIPAFHRRYCGHSSFGERWNFRELYCEFRTTAFCRRLEARGIVISEADWHHHLEGHQFADVLRALFACYRAQTGAIIVGDKTPEYLTQVPLLTRLLPESRFVHIVRDPRDHVLSMRKAWRKSVPRSAYRWKTQVRKYCDDVAATSTPQVTVRYEDLVTEPAATLTRVCGFLGIEFQPQMISLDTSSEELGDARGLKTVVSDNTRKWVAQLSDADLRSIDSMAGVVMSKFGYQPTTSPGDGDLNWFKRVRSQAADAINQLRYRYRTEGSVVAALRESWRAYRHSGADE